MQILDRLLDEIAVAIPNVAELGSRDPHKEQTLPDVAVPRGLKPGIERLAVHLLFERGEDLYPGIKSDRRRNSERHAQSSMQNVRESEATDAAKPDTEMPEAKPCKQKWGRF
jgi:hypothetical protein